MGYFDLPTGEFSLNLKPKRVDCDYNGWRSVMFTDSLTVGDIADCVEDWEDSYEVLGAMYNGHTVTIPTNYHWELRNGDEMLGRFNTRKEAAKVMKEQRNLRRKDKTVKVGFPVFVQD